MDDSDCQIIDSDDDLSVIIVNVMPGSTSGGPRLAPAVQKTGNKAEGRTTSPFIPGETSTGFVPFKSPPLPRLEKKFVLDDRSARNQRPTIEQTRPSESIPRVGKSKKKKNKKKNNQNAARNLNMDRLSLESDNHRLVNRPGRHQASGQRFDHFRHPNRNSGPASKPSPPKDNALVNYSGQHASGPLPALLPHMTPQNMISNNNNNNNKRFIVIDGSNVAVTHGIDVTHKKAFSCMGIKLTVDYFVKRGHTQIKALVPRFRRGCSDYQCPTLNPEILDQLEQKGYLTYTPSRFVDNKLVLPYDDRFILKTALHYDAVIVSNDNYRDLWSEDERWKKLIQTNLLQYSFVNDLFLIADDPFGRHGPTIDQFLSADYAKAKANNNNNNYNSAKKSNNRRS